MFGSLQEGRLPGHIEVIKQHRLEKGEGRAAELSNLLADRSAPHGCLVEWPGTMCGHCYHSDVRLGHSSCFGVSVVVRLASAARLFIVAQGVAGPRMESLQVPGVDHQPSIARQLISLASSPIVLHLRGAV